MDENLGQWWGVVYFLFGVLLWPVAFIEGLVFLFTPEKVAAMPQAI